MKFHYNFINPDIWSKKKDKQEKVSSTPFHKEDIFSIQTEDEFNRQALKTFAYQYEQLPVYRKFCNHIHRTSPSTYLEIPFLPISFFKTHRIVASEKDREGLTEFKSSGTTQTIRSHHHLVDTSLYESSFSHTFTHQIVQPKEAIILALLPNYLEQGYSSLVYMVDYLIKESGDERSGFYLYEHEELINVIQSAKKTKKKIILFGVSYALLDLAEKNIDLSSVIIIETGGMKGRRKEMIREELHEKLKKGLHASTIQSEYGMTELLSQAYMNTSGWFTPPKWMKVMIRDIYDPFQEIKNGRTGGINIIDLANYYSCSFISTEDLGRVNGNTFKIMGRFDSSDLRGCNLLLN